MHFSLLVSVFDVDSEEGGTEDDPAGGGDAQDRVHRRLHSGLLHLVRFELRSRGCPFYPFERPVLWRPRLVVEHWPCHWVTSECENMFQYSIFSLYVSRLHLSMWRVRVTPEYSPMHRSSSPEFELFINSWKWSYLFPCRQNYSTGDQSIFNQLLSVCPPHNSSSPHFKMVFDPIMQCQYPRNCSVGVFSLFDRVWLFDEQFERTTGWSSGWLSRGFHPRPTIWLIKTFREMAMSW